MRRADNITTFMCGLSRNSGSRCLLEYVLTFTGVPFLTLLLERVAYNTWFTYFLTNLFTYLLACLLTYFLTYLLTYLLTQWYRVLLEKLNGFQLVKKFPAFYGTRRFNTAFTSVRHFSLS